MIDWINFTPLNSLLGGICIGISAIIMLLTNGRIMGISGILGDIISFKENEQFAWRAIFVIGILVALYAVLRNLDIIKIILNIITFY